jgi:hypothetical protein
MFLIFVSTFLAAMNGVILRAFMSDKKNSVYYFRQSLLIGFVLATYAALLLCPPEPTFDAGLGLAVIYYAIGWVVSDLTDTFVFIFIPEWRRFLA